MIPVPTPKAPSLLADKEAPATVSRGRVLVAQRSTR